MSEVKAETIDFAKAYPPRADRIHEKPSPRNAQGLFPVEACIFIGNITNDLTIPQQEKGLEEIYSKIGTCHVKVKDDKFRNLQGAFIQFEKAEHATKALELGKAAKLGERILRAERVRGERTGRLSLLTGEHITEDEAKAVLKGRGSLLGMCIDYYSLFGGHNLIATCIVTFAYIDDYNDAIKHFQKDSRYQLHKTHIEGNPFANGGKPDLRNARPPNPPYRGNQSRPRMNGNVYHSPGPNYRGNGRGFGRNNRRNFPRENHHYSPPHNYEDYPPWNDPPFIQPAQRYPRPFNQPFQQGPGPSRMAPGAPPFIPHQNEIHHLPHPGNGNYAPPGNGYNGQPVHNGDFNGSPSPYMAPATNDPLDRSRHNPGNPEPIPVSHQGPNPGPLIVHSQPQFNPPHPNGQVPHTIPDGPMNGFMSTPTMCNPNYPEGPLFNVHPNPNMAGNMRPFNLNAPEQHYQQQYQQCPRPAPWMIPIHEWSPPPEFFPNIATEPPVRHTTPNRIVEITSDQDKHSLEDEKLASDQESAVASSDKAKSNEDSAPQTENRSDEAQAPNGKKENETENQESEEKESTELTESTQSPQNGDNNKEDSGEDTLTEAEVEEEKTPDKGGTVNPSSNDSKCQEHTVPTNGKETNGKEEKENGDGIKKEKGLADMIQEIYITTRVNEEEKFSSPSVEQKYLAEIAKELEEERKLKVSKEKEEKEAEEKKKKDLLKSPKLVTT